MNKSVGTAWLPLTFRIILSQDDRVNEAAQEHDYLFTVQIYSYMKTNRMFRDHMLRKGVKKEVATAYYTLVVYTSWFQWGVIKLRNKIKSLF